MTFGVCFVLACRGLRREREREDVKLRCLGVIRSDDGVLLLVRSDAVLVAESDASRSISVVVLRQDDQIVGSALGRLL